MHAFKAELLGVISALEYAQQFNWCRLWFESDSSYVVQLLRSQIKSVPWKWHTRWVCALNYLSEIPYCVYIGREIMLLIDLRLMQ